MRKKDDILRAAERLFYNNGFHATSTDRICSEAGVSTRTLYRYFPSREALTEAVMAARQQRFFSALLPPDNPDAVRHLFTVLSEWTETHGASGCFFIKAWGEYAEADQRLSALALDYRYRLRRYIGDCVTQAQQAASPVLADAIWMLFEGAITSALVLGAAAARHAGEASVRLLLTQETTP